MKYTETNPVIFVENVSVQYDDKVIIKDVNITEKNVIRTDQITGQIIAFVGRSGRGKSTLFKVLTGLIKPNTGRVLIANPKNPENANEIKEGVVGFVDQKYTLFRNKTVYETFLFAMRLKNISIEEKNTIINTYLKNWGLENLKDKYPNELSGGQRQRTAIIEQILCSEMYLVLDEPFSGLDVGNIEEVKKSFKLISQSHEMNTLIFSTHDIELAVELSDVVYIIGYPTLENNTLANYGTIIKKYDLKEMGLAWQPYSAKHFELAQLIKQDLLQS